MCKLPLIKVILLHALDAQSVGLTVFWATLKARVISTIQVVMGESPKVWSLSQRNTDLSCLSKLWAENLLRPGVTVIFLLQPDFKLLSAHASLGSETVASPARNSDSSSPSGRTKGGDPAPVGVLQCLGEPLHTRSPSKYQETSLLHVSAWLELVSTKHCSVKLGCYGGGECALCSFNT